MAEDCTVVRFSKDHSTARIENYKNNDSPDRLSDTVYFGTFYVICVIFSIFSYVADLTLACFLLYFYSVNGYGVYFALTLTFVVMPAIILTAFNMRWYIIDNDDASLGKVSLCQWVVRIIFLLLQISPLLRYIDTLIYGLKSRYARMEHMRMTLSRRMLDEDTNGALLRLFHCFLHSAPQAVIQLMFLLMQLDSSDGNNIIREDIAVLQAWTVIVAVVSVAWSLTSYHRSVRYSRDDKENVSWSATMVAFCWHFMSTVSRVLALSMLAAIYPWWMGVVCALHWGVMAIWLALSQTSACSSHCEELLLSMALGFAYVIAFISPRDGPTRYAYLVYYLVCLMENTGALVVWYFQSSLENYAYLRYGAALAQIVSFLLAIVFLLVYYRHCHPSTAGRGKILEITDPNSLELNKPGYSKSYSSHHPN
ncbi:XK-related protein 6 [Agrilus planipennis]|uniref:XK-related protein n=1 Tax=Agrilus planipennis TaxID=224129 RepID=A0A1W4WBV9_AGRPL|nr:XK-related protein 6 [Agrilus planipennis]